MCGIVGYIGNEEKKKIIINGLKELEYRGYDSAGLAVMDESANIKYFKAVGKLNNDEDQATLRLVNNYDWTKDLSLLDFLRDYGKHFNLNTNAC